MSGYFPSQSFEHPESGDGFDTHELLNEEISDAELPRDELSSHERSSQKPNIRSYEVEGIEEHAENVRHSVPRKKWESWSTPTTMIASFILGVVFAVSHHCYYKELDDTIVGSAKRQQWAIRFGTAFAFLTQACLVNATTISYIQWVWRRCRERAVRVGALDAAFAVDRSALMFFKARLPFEFQLATLLAITFWCMPLTSLITPATLTIASKLNTIQLPVSVNQPDMSDRELDLSFPKAEQILSIVSKTGERRPIEAPGGLGNISYTVQITVPVIRCNESDEVIRAWTLSAIRDSALQSMNISHSIENATEFNAQNLTLVVPKGTEGAKDERATAFGYFAQRPAQSRCSNCLLSQPTGINDDQANDISIAIASPGDNDLDTDGVSYYTCRMRNATMNATFSFINDQRSLETTILGEEDISLSIYEEYGIVDNWRGTLYSLIEGEVSRYGIIYGEASEWTFGSTTKADQTVLGTAKDFAAMAAKWDTTDSNSRVKYSDSVAQDKSFTTLIEELSLNASLSFMSESLLSRRVEINGTRTISVNRYTYNPQNLLIAYGCSIFACFLATIAGCYAIYINGASYDNHFSTISRTMQGQDIVSLFDKLQPEASAMTSGISWKKNVVAKTRIRLHTADGAERFRIEDMDVEMKSFSPIGEAK